MKHIIDKLNKLRKFTPTKDGMIENYLGDYFYDTDVLNLLANSPQADGMVLVPSEPTDSQINAGRKYFDNTYDWTFLGLYKAMLSAYKPQADDVRKDAWISVEDKPMPTDSPFLSYRNGNVRSCYFYVDMFDKVVLGGVGWCFPNDDMPTHWQPLPAPPLDKARE